MGRLPHYTEVICVARKTRMNSITSPDLLAQVNPENKRLKTDFLNYLKSIQSSPGTIRGYSNDLDIFFVWVLQNANNKEFAKVSKRDIVSFQNWMINDNGNSPARVRRIKAAISSMSNFIETVLDEEEEYRDFRSIVRKIKNPPLAPVQEKTVWEEDELDKLLETLTDMGEYKKACYVALGVYSGRRKAELARFKVVDFDDSRLVFGGAMYRTKEKMKTKGRGLGKYIYCYTLAKPFKPYFDAWMKYRDENGIESEWLFPDANDQSIHIKESTINSWTALFSRITGRDFYMHSLRHAFVSNLSREGLPDNAIQTLVGWESADMVGVYKDFDAEDELAMYFTENGEIRTDIAISPQNL